MTESSGKRFEPPVGEHPFAGYIRILGKGKSGSRSLSFDEARSAFSMLLRGEVEDLQLGAFLMLLRVKEETGAELGGFVQACRDEMQPPPSDVQAELDWSSYAGKKHQHPWYILSALLLSQAGHRVFLHGADGHTPDRLYTEQAMSQLGLPVANNWQNVRAQLDSSQLSYLPLRCFCFPLHQMIQLKPLLGLRSPVNTLTRMLNPLRAPFSIQSVFHPAYAALHQAADRLLDQPAALVFKGDSGEAEIKPQADTRLSLLQAQEKVEMIMPRERTGRVDTVPAPSVAPLRELWRDSRADAYGEAATLTTTAAALLLINGDRDLGRAKTLARTLWNARDTERLD